MVIAGAERARLRGLPDDWFMYPLVRSYAVERGLDLYRVEIRQHPETGMRVTARFPMPKTQRSLTGRYTGH